MYFRDAYVYRSYCSAARSREVRGSLRKNGVKVIIKMLAFSKSVLADVELLCIVDGMELDLDKLLMYLYILELFVSAKEVISLDS